MIRQRLNVSLASYTREMQTAHIAQPFAGKRVHLQMRDDALQKKEKKMWRVSRHGASNPQRPIVSCVGN
ncbi:MAG: hypothetical protein KC413_25600, partial [Anaerolineales bacterium]|nr:hypothetical protein [Anaerolineales bacterium]